jgi:hypothetical protein
MLLSPWDYRWCVDILPVLIELLLCQTGSPPNVYEDLNTLLLLSSEHVQLKLRLGRTTCTHCQLVAIDASFKYLPFTKGAAG